MDMIVLLPVYEDWTPALQLIRELDSVLWERGITAAVVLVNDGSGESLEQIGLELTALREIHLLNLRRNLGHQAAIAVGLAAISQTWPEQAVAIMDADGQDKVSDLVRLFDESNRLSGGRVVFAARGRRSEGPVFQILYRLYRLLFRALTGASPRLGNFCVLSPRLVQQAVGISEIWSSLPWGILKAKLPFASIKCDRAARYSGDSKMPLISLFEHGLTALSVFSERVALRALIALTFFGLCALALIAAAVIIKTTTDLAIPGWSTSVVGFGVSFLLQLSSLSLLFLFIVLQNKNQMRILPVRDYSHYILNSQIIWQSST